ncbi:OadG family transporter subunit [Stutzerimonas stutzeri]|uniref:OadG family protein n=1 Tax=Stutzerimonas sp. S1 TaxID=3030652 RepID=UPI0022246CED|nr:OadG family transporter subunit [Stutzerimonas sp. S1]MCW3150133.1 OadG family transporter subunit [Stutzerimonas sp. S1]
MTPGELLLEGVELMLFGLGFVYLFLILLIVCIRLMSSLTTRFASEPIPHAPAQAVVETDAEILAAIQAAIHQHRARRG